MDIDQYIDIFLDESKEHVQHLNDCLMDLENNPENLDTVNEIFRIAHTLKGMSATMGFQKVSKLTHKMENVFDGIRSHKLEVNQDIIDILFEGLDILEANIKNIEDEGVEHSMDVTDLINRLDVIEKGGSIDNDVSNASSSENNEVSNDSDDSSNIGIQVPEEDQEVIYNIISEFGESYHLYQIHVTIEEKCMLKSARAYIVFKGLEDSGEIVFSNPSVEVIEEEDFGREFSLLYVTQLAKEEIKNLILSTSEIENVKISDYNFEQIMNTVSQNVTKREKTQSKKEETLNNDDRKVTIDKNENQAQSAKKHKKGKMVRVDIDRLDNLMNLVSELIIVKTRLENKEIFTKPQNLTDAIEYLERITTSLHDAVTKVRMVPIERVFNRFPRMVRDLSKDLKKDINLIMEGEETEVDRTVIDEIGDPLIHMLRNSVDHGIESPEIRKQNGKKEEGTVRLIAYPDGNTVVIEVTDDGAGINVEKVKAKAIEKGILTEEQAKDIDDSKAAELIMAPGFSTADHVSSVSGRGVGLDVVKNKIESLNGVVEIQTESGKGSAFIIRLPLTLAIIQALMVVVGGEKYAIPLNNIKEITDLNTEDFRLIEGKEVILYRGNTLQLVRLSEVLDCENKERTEGVVTVVIARKGDREVGLIIDNLIGQQEIVIKSLGSYLNFVKEIAGATILGNGGVALIIDTNSLF